MGLIQRIRDRQTKRQALATSETYSPAISAGKSVPPLIAALLYPVLKAALQRAGVEVTDQTLAEVVLVAYGSFLVGKNWFKNYLLPRIASRPKLIKK
jgi:hypothetical protein